MPGGFHPFHAGHMALYNSARQAFPNADLYVAATNSQEERPFPFAVKEKLAKVAGVEPGHFIQVKSPFQAKEITQNYNPEQDVLIFVRSEKDRNESPKPGGTKKDGSPAYFQPWTGKDVQPFGKHAYFAYLPTVKFGPGITSATEIRKAWPTLNDKRKTAMVMSLYPAAQKNQKLAANIVAMLDQVMGVQQGVAEGWKGAVAGGIAGGMIGGFPGALLGSAGGYVLGGGNPNEDLPDDIESAYELGQQAARDGKTEEDNPYEEGMLGPSRAMEAWHDGWESVDQGVTNTRLTKSQPTGRIDPTTPSNQPAKQDNKNNTPIISKEPNKNVNPELQKRLAARKAGNPKYGGGLEEGSQSKDDLIWTLNNFDYYTDNGSVYVNDNGDKIARIGSNWKHQSGKIGSGAEELSAFLSSLQDVNEGFGINYPGTYEQENNMFKGHGQRRIGDLTNETSLSESTDYLEEK
jgi:hypothetical protein